MGNNKMHKWGKKRGQRSRQMGERRKKISVIEGRGTAERRSSWKEASVKLIITN